MLRAHHTTPNRQFCVNVNHPRWHGWLAFAAIASLALVSPVTAQTPYPDTFTLRGEWREQRVFKQKYETEEDDQKVVKEREIAARGVARHR